MKDYKLTNTPDKVNLPVKNTDDLPAVKKDLTPVPVRIQNKLAINTPGDRHEQEADDMANKVVGQSSPDTSNSAAASNTSSLIKEGDGGNRLVNDVLQSTGRPLQNNTKSFMESRFNQNFSNVRIHDDSKAAQSATAINAKAYTHGNHIVFNKGTDHNAAGGRHLLAHELSHVVQQSASGAAGNLLQRQPLTPALDGPMPAVDLRDSVSPLLAGALGSAEISRFKTGSEEIPAEGMDTLHYSAKQILFFIQKFSLSTVTVKGHTDKVGTDENNASLGQRRADAVKDFLIKEGVPETMIATESKGETSPAVPTKDNVAEPRNRRVEVRFSVKKNAMSFGMEMKLNPPQQQVQIVKPPEPPKINLNITEEPKPVGPVRNPDETALWKKMEDVQKGIDAYNKSHPQKNSSISDYVLDGVMDKAIKPLLKKLPISDKLREKAEGLIRDGIESGIEKAVDAAIDALPPGADKEAIKQAAKAALKQK